MRWLKNILLDPVLHLILIVFLIYYVMSLVPDDDGVPFYDEVEYGARQ